MAPRPMKPHDASRESDCENARIVVLELQTPKVLRRRARLHNDALIFAGKQDVEAGL